MSMCECICMCTTCLCLARFVGAHACECSRVQYSPVSVCVLVCEKRTVRVCMRVFALVCVCVLGKVTYERKQWTGRIRDTVAVERVRPVRRVKRNKLA